MVKSVVLIGFFILLLIQSVSAGERVEKKTGKSRIILVKKYECQPFVNPKQSDAAYHPTTAVAAIANRGIIVAAWDSLSEYSLSLIDFNGSIIRSAKHSWGFPTHLYYNQDRHRIYFWQASDAGLPLIRKAYELDTNLNVVDSFSVKNYPDWFIKVGMMKSNRRAEIDNILKKIRKIAGGNGCYAQKDMWRYVSFIGNRYILLEREVGNSAIAGYDLSKKKAFRFVLRENTLSVNDSVSLYSVQCESFLRGVVGDRKICGGCSGVAVSEKEFIFGLFGFFNLVDVFEHVTLDED